MAIELQVLGYAALLHFVQFLLMAIPVNVQLGVSYTAGARDEQQEPTGTPGRLYRAMNNHIENLVIFTIAVLVVVLGDASSGTTEAAAWTYLIARILYVPAYVSGIFMLRSVVFGAGFGATLLMLLAALF
ncbi:MAG: MAPEG family protein [Pseudomonadota bacterium]